MANPLIEQEGSRSRWNEKYARKGPEAFDRDPSQWLAVHRALLEAQPKGKALDVACGNGRNSIFLAELGFDVDAVDISNIAVDWLTRRAKEQGLKIDAIWADLTRYSFPSSAYDVIVNLNYLERSIFQQLTQALKPGGLLLFETFAGTETEGSGKPMNPVYTLEPGELRDAFPELEVIDYREEATAESGIQHKNEVARLVARKPSP